MSATKIQFFFEIDNNWAQISLKKLSNQTAATISLPDNSQWLRLWLETGCAEVR